MAQVGRISGPLLTANLERNGIDLSFRDTLSSTSLLKLDVTNNRLAINRNTATVALDVTGGDVSQNTLETDTAKLANLYFENQDEINVLSGNILVNSQDIINVSNLSVGNIFVTDNTISSTSGNISLDTNGTGIVVSNNNINVSGDISATGNITLDGNLTFGDAGDDSTQIVDTVTIDGEIDSNIVPSGSTRTLGTDDLRWSELNARELSVDNIIAESYNLGNYNTELRQGNSIYVAVNGSDDNEGDHPNSPFATIRRALAFADASISGPVTIFIFPGEYQEELPLEVPSQVTVKGVDFRSCIIVADTNSQSEDVFLMNGESTVSDVTIKGFYYDSVNDKGYAFRFAPNTTVTTRSPYIQNISVITQGSTTSADDPRGFAAGDAGKGALVDGADVTSNSREASMLFHSVTFITPGVNALTMTNGVRVEWLNSFSYFADKGLYAFNGTTGHLSTDGSTIKYGAELRSIGSASVYGNVGAEADGDDVIMYLIMHNFGYVGSGKHVDNDPSRAIQSQEVVELNNGSVFFQSTDHKGDFRVGQEFFASQETGETSLEITEGDVDSINGLTVTQGINVTTIDGTEIRFPNFLLKGNKIETTTGEVIVAPAEDLVVNADLTIGNSLTVTGSMTVDGAINDIGNAPTDTVDFDAEFNNNLEPTNPGQSDLGSTARRWQTVNLGEANISDVRIQENYITTSVSNSDIELRANGTGIIDIPSNNVQVDNNLTANGTTDLQGVGITGSFNYVGNRLLKKTEGAPANLDIAGNFNVTGTFDMSSTSTFNMAQTKIGGNALLATQQDADLELGASGTGEVRVPNETLRVEGKITGTNYTVGDIEITEAMTMPEFSTGDILVRDNFITTTQSNSNLELRANGTGRIRFEDVFIGTAGYTNNVVYTESGNLVFNPEANAVFDSTKTITLPRGTTAQRSTTQASFRYNTTQNVFEGRHSGGYSPLSGVTSDNYLTSVTADTTGDVLRFTIGGVSNPLDSTDLAGEITSTEMTLVGLQVEDVLFDDNVVTTNVSNSNLELEANGTGDLIVSDNITLQGNKIIYDNNLIVTNIGNGYTKINSQGAFVIPSGTDAQRPPTEDQTGRTRYNTEQAVLETWSGTEWIVSAGSSASVSEEFMQQQADLFAIVLG